MNSDDLHQLRELVTDIVAPIGADAHDASRAANDANSEIRALRIDINGGDGRPGLKERLATMEATCKVRHGTADTQQRAAVSAELAQTTLARLESPNRSLPPREKARLQITRLQVIAAAITTLGTLAGAYLLGRAEAPSPTHSVAAPVR